VGVNGYYLPVPVLALTPIKIDAAHNSIGDYYWQNVDTNPVAIFIA